MIVLDGGGLSDLRGVGLRDFEEVASEQPLSRWVFIRVSFTWLLQMGQFT